MDSENGPAWTALGHCYLLVEDLQKSFNAYQRALYSLEEIKDPQLWYGIGILYEKFESYNHAISALVAVLKMSPNFYQKSEVLYKLGMIFAKTNQIQQAISYFQNSILTNTFTQKRKTDTLLKIGLLYEEQKNYSQAMKEYEAASISDKSNFKIYQHLAWCSFQMNNIDKALEYCKTVEGLKQGQADTLYIQGRCYMAQDDLKKALELFQEAAFKYPGEAAYWATLAIVYYKNGDYTDSFENIIKSTSLNTLKHELWYNLGILYEKCKQPEESLIAYQKVQELYPGEPDSQLRIKEIKSPYYNSQYVSNINLKMKQPHFQLPNSLTILKKYKKKPEGEDGQNADGNLNPDSRNLQQVPEQSSQVILNNMSKQSKQIEDKLAEINTMHVGQMNPQQPQQQNPVNNNMLQQQMPKEVKEELPQEPQMDMMNRMMQ